MYEGNLGEIDFLLSWLGSSYQESTVFGCNNAVVLKLGLYTYTSNYLLLLYHQRLGNLALCLSLFKV